MMPKVPMVEVDRYRNTKQRYQVMEISGFLKIGVGSESSDPRSNRILPGRDRNCYDPHSPTGWRARSMPINSESLRLCRKMKVQYVGPTRRGAVRDRDFEAHAALLDCASTTGHMDRDAAIMEFGSKNF